MKNRLIAKNARPLPQRGRPRKYTKIESTGPLLTTVAQITVPEYSISEFSALRDPVSALIPNPDKPHGPTSRMAWITDGPTYYSVQFYIETTQTDTECRDTIAPTETSSYIELHEYSEPNRYDLVAKVRVPEFGHRPELMSVNAGPTSSSATVMKLIRDTIEIPFKIPGFTLHDAAYCKYLSDQFSIRKLRDLAGESDPSIYQRHGFQTATLYRRSVGQYKNHTQIPILNHLARQFIKRLPLDWMTDVFVPLIKRPLFTDRIQDTIATAIKRWCPVPTAETIQQLFAKLLTASKHFKTTNDKLSINGALISKRQFYSDLNLLLNVMMSEVYSDEDAHAIRNHALTIPQLPPGSLQWAFLTQCAMNCTGSHIIFERRNNLGYIPLSIPIHSTPTADFRSFPKAVASLTDTVPLTWTEFCQSDGVAELFNAI